MADELKPDICVIGGGPGGLAVAMAAANGGVPVALVERERTGGANLTRGTIPARALAAAAGYYETLRRGPAIGVTGAPLQVNFARVADHIQSVVEAVGRTVSPERLAALGVQVVPGTARFTDRSTVAVGETVIRARRFVVATGASPAPPPLPGLDAVDAMTIADALDLNRKMAHLMIVGAGAHGLELAQAYNRLGVDATVIDQGEALPGCDPELAAAVLERLAAEGVRVRTGVTIEGLARRRGGIRIAFADRDGEAVVDGSHLLVAAGRRPNIAGLGLEAAGVTFTDAGITVDRHFRTSNRRVYAIGDVVGGPASATRAQYQAGLVVRAILYRLPIRDEPYVVPSVVATDPGIASVGFNEAEATRLYRDIRVLRWPFVDNDLSQIERTTGGLVKLVTTARGRVLGAAIAGRDAGELIAFWSLAIARRLHVDDLRDVVTAHPGRSDAGQRAAASFHGPGLTPAWRRRIIEVLRKFG